MLKRFINRYAIHFHRNFLKPIKFVPLGTEDRKSCAIFLFNHAQSMIMHYFTAIDCMRECISLHNLHMKLLTANHFGIVRFASAFKRYHKWGMKDSNNYKVIFMILYSCQLSCVISLSGNWLHVAYCRLIALFQHYRFASLAQYFLHIIARLCATCLCQIMNYY